LLIAEEVEVQTSADGRATAAYGRTVSARALPVEDLDLRLGVRGGRYQDRLGAERLVIEAALVGVSQGFSDLPHQCQAHADIKLIAALAQEEIEAHGRGVMFEDQCWPALVLGEGLGFENSGVIQPLQQ
jgi:hypothetical protein